MVSLSPHICPAFVQQTSLVSIYGALNKNVPRKFIYLNAWSLISGTIWEGLELCSCWRRYVLVEGDVSLGMGFQMPMPGPVSHPLSVVCVFTTVPVPCLSFS